MRGERGSALSVLLVGCWTIIIIGLVVAADFGRLFIYREQLRGAAEAAALAGAMHVTKMASVTVSREEYWEFSYTCPKAETGEEETEKQATEETCWDWGWDPAPPVYREGREDDLWRNKPGSYLDLCQHPFRCLDEAWSFWLEPKGGGNGPLQVAEAVFYANDQWGREENVVVRWVEVECRPDSTCAGDRPRFNWGEFWVLVDAELEMPTHLWGIIGGRRTMRVTMTQPARAIPIRR